MSYFDNQRKQGNYFDNPETGGKNILWLKKWKSLQEKKTSLVAQTVKRLSTIQETWVRSPGEGNGTPLQYSCLENPMDRGAW